MQYTSYQKFGHIGDRCSTRAYRFCAAAYLSKDHPCPTCLILGRPCEHTTPLCINYKEKHFANSKDCENLRAAKLVYAQYQRRRFYRRRDKIKRILEGGNSYQAPSKKIVESKRIEINCKRIGIGVRISYSFSYRFLIPQQLQ